MIPVILSGGTGTRLWPLSRQAYPKQFLSLIGEGSMFQQTLQRLPWRDVHSPVIVANCDHRFLVQDQLSELQISPQTILLEPFGRNTAPAVALAALVVARDDPEAIMLVLPADHLIDDGPGFQVALEHARGAAERGQLVLFGITPTRPETGYGYVAVEPSSDGIMPVQRFVEKPDAATAQDMLEIGGYYWNSGMFMFRASSYLEELKSHRADIYEACVAAAANLRDDLGFVRVPEEIFKDCPDESVDYAVMEHTKNAVLVPLDLGWSDVGSWSALWDVQGKDERQNVVVGDTCLEDTHGCLIHARDKLVAMLGVQDLVVVDTKDALMVAQRDRVQDVKKLVNQLKVAKRSETENHREVFRPWGSYDSIDNGNRFQVKHITVKPGERLSLQRHHHRAEHWIVVRGTAQVTRNEETFLLSENQSTYIPIGATHRLTNPGKIPLELIEVQSGAYLGEDDIERFDDIYGRTEKAEPEIAPANVEG
ncbi:mannose-1-phosphate guanylyltransferase/mannose-6-phosphate isomerase [Marinobacter sp. M216]|uniref:mannose-1-phosphate guanylyltransferase n=1 Tax=Marinobacter albus TaxID=3030833 RepID=A0ABT7HBH4_9GAMM|nr:MULTISPECIES: mannose-1-phosphate guanylyltransferase/mannose-6-phosphate isomerase [unclassified Marinobacter]MBW7470391.1 mannose-1-phosphate guanylyltransferase/mannose-6-phosphate isomerase [Marinobacter sp. F4218]MDK9557344.1 mannose-1-phosphate guanylyltransferase/mannose-6-phosphate isomerase [Marinobacter sp. M216]